MLSLEDGGSAAQSKYGALHFAATDSMRFFAAPMYAVAMNCMRLQSSCCCFHVSRVPIALEFDTSTFSSQEI